MSLATRCTSCNTVFRVVQDQLKVSEGWVRCGRCHEVFNALESLFDLEPAAAAIDPAPAPAAASRVTAEEQNAEPEPAASPAPDAAPEPSPPHLRQAPAAPEHWLPPLRQTPAAPEPSPLPLQHSPAAPATEPVAAASAAPQAGPVAEHEHEHGASSRATPPSPAAVPAPLAAWPPPAFDATARSGFSSAHSTPASRLDARDRNDFEDARFNSELFADAGIEPQADAAEASIDEVAPGAADDAAATPDFLRRAERRARWDRPAVAVAMALACGVLLLVLAGQAAYHFRDLLATTHPQTRPALLALCELAGCRIEPLRRIDDIAIESSALTAAPTGNAIRLSLVLRNRGALALAMPAIELSLTDPGGQLLARRALLPADFEEAGATLAAGAETPLQLVLAVEGRRPSGYTVEPFYP